MNSTEKPAMERAADSVVLGDRLCIKCSYNLRGQPVMRESEYGLYLVRCPECGTPAAIQEYPLLGRWPGRLRVLALVAYLGALLVLFGITSVMISGMSGIVASKHRDAYSQLISEAWIDYEFNQHEAGVDLLTPMGIQNTPRQANGRLVPGQWNAVGRPWWDNASKRLPFATFRSRILLILRTDPALLATFSALYFGIGAIWPVALIATRRRWLVLAVLLPGLVVYELMLIFGGSSPFYRGWEYAMTLAYGELFPPSLLVVMVLWVVFGTLGVVFGRSLARVFVRVMIPPTLRGSLAELWFTDGKPLPTGTRMSRRLYPEIDHPQPTHSGEPTDEHL